MPKIRITGRGLYGFKGAKEFPIGHEMTVREVPAGWRSRVTVLDGEDDNSEKQFVVADQVDPLPTKKADMQARLDDYGVAYGEDDNANEIRKALSDAHAERKATLGKLAAEGYAGDTEGPTNAQLADELAAIEALKT